jgi:hypothetical protein
MIPEEVKNYLTLIDGKYEEMKGQVPRISKEWGVWSREMNLEIRKKIEEGNPHSTKLKYVFNYWINRSQLLDLHFKKRSMFGKAAKKRLAREGKRLREILHEDHPPSIKNPWKGIPRIK